METELKVLVPLKGNVESDTITLVHYIPKEGIAELDSRLLKFKYGNRKVTFKNSDGTKRTVKQPKRQYLVFLKRHTDGKYEAAAGHYDSMTSISELPMRYVAPSTPSSGFTATN